MSQTTTVLPFNQYMSAWNKTIPLLRQINPAAQVHRSGGHQRNGFYNYMPRFLKGVKASGVMPDAISFHYYPCWQMDEATCLASAATYTCATQQVRNLVTSILGRDLPIGLSEWNYDPRNPPPSYGDNADFITKFTTAAIKSMVDGGVAFACQFDAASYSGYGRLDMIDVNTGLPKPQFDALASLIKQYKPRQLPAINGYSDGSNIAFSRRHAICSSNNPGRGEQAR